MRTAYRVLAYLIALEVIIQSAVVVYGFFGLIKWVDGGATLDSATMDDESTSFAGLGGLIVHWMNGMYLIPLIALVFLLVSFGAKVPGGVKWAGYVFLAVIIQVLLGLFAHEVPALGALHGINALVLFGLAVMAGVRAGRTLPSSTSTPTKHEHV